ncbi:MAG: AraC family transcriptional regulator [Clostridia bacterium]|nr:AraC family transcriptional regulator [Clostridia bacterium]
MNIDKNIEKKEYQVKYPQKERAYAIIPHGAVPFESAVVGITYPSADYEMSRSEKHRVCVFEYVMSGEGEIFIDGKRQSATAGDFYILPAGKAHAYRSSHDNPWEKIWVNYVSEYMPTLLGAYGIKGGVYHSDKVARYFEELSQLAKENILGNDTFFRIADILYKIVKAAAIQNEKADEDNLEMKRLIASYIYKKLNLDEFANMLNMSKTNAIRLYKKRYGITPYEDLINMKIEAAKTLLTDTTLPIKEISEKLCIYDEHYFSSLFLSKTGKRPSIYRKGNSM